MTAIAIRKDSMRTMQVNNDGSESGDTILTERENRYQERRCDMTLFTKRNCTLCDQLKERFDLAAMDVTVEVLDMNSPGALAHLAWHSLVDTARRALPLLVLDDSSAVSEYTNIEHLLAARAGQYGVGYVNTDTTTGCESGICTIMN